MIKYNEKLKGASDQDINMWELFFSQTMPLEYRQFIRKSDGPSVSDDETNGEFQFFSIRKAIEYYRNNLFKESCPNAIPICLDGHGNLAVYRMEDSAIVGIFVMSASNLDWASSTEVGKSIQELLQIRIADEVNKKSGK